jgi:formylglycine-generating enzyme required for sulfatase activity
VDFGFEDHPVICVNWFGASAFAAWIGGRLPTEAEWENACRGGVEGFTFPWGNDKPNHSLANFGENVGSTTPVGKYPPNRFGLYDMTGNTWEWCKDWYRKDYYKKSPKINPGGPSSGVDKVVRGGGWAYGMETLRCAKREKRWARVGGTNIGFRVAFDVRTEGLRR